MPTVNDLPQSFDWIVKLVSLDTVTRNSNLPVIELIADEARRLGLTPQICPAPYPGKANLLVTVPAEDGSTAGGVVLSGHSDVVPVDDQDWTSDPFTPTIRDGKLFGRGTCDMKGFLGVAVSKLETMVNTKLREPIHLAVSYDEEIGCIGGDQIVKDIANLGLAPRAAIIGEPSSMQVITGHKSISAITVIFHGVAAHSSLVTEGTNAVEYAAKFITKVRENSQQWKTEGPFDESYKIPYSTAGVNVAHGGIAGNTIPEECTVHMDFRAVPGVDQHATEELYRSWAQELEQEMKAEHEQCSVEFLVDASVPGLNIAPDAAAVSLGVRLGGQASDEKVTYGTEAGQFAGAGIEAIVCGPGDIAQAHAPNEYVALDQLLACEDFIQRLIDELAV